MALSGAGQPTWAFYEGICDATQQTLRQVLCGGAPEVQLKAGSYFFVVEGTGGNYDLALF